MRLIDRAFHALVIALILWAAWFVLVTPSNPPVYSSFDETGNR